MIKAMFFVLAAFAAMQVGCASSAIPTSSGPKAPEFIGSADDWLNSQPLTMKGLRGKVVIVDFWEYTCINCVRTYPYLKEWWNRYKDKGLVIVGIDSPEFKFGGSRKNIEASAKKYGLDFPLLVDSNYANWNAWNNESWPCKYLVDADGNVIEKHEGEGGYGDFEREIQEQLKKINPSVQLPPIMQPVRPDDAPGAMSYPLTDEMYAGERGLESGAFGYRNRPIGQSTLYHIPSSLEEGVIYLDGYWTPGDEYLQASTGGILAMRYMAKEVDMVLRPVAGPVEVEVLQDGKPVDSEDAGSDIVYKNGRSYMEVSTGRMYVPVRNAVWGHHRLDFRAEGPGLQVYSFAFASEAQKG